MPNDMSTVENPQFNRFAQVGTPKRDMERHAITSLHNPPDIRMQLGPDDDKDNKDRLSEERLRNTESYYGADPTLQKIIAGLRYLDRPEEDLLVAKRGKELPDDERDRQLREIARQRTEIRERLLPEQWQAFMIAGLQQTESMIDEQLFRFKSPYPYESRVYEQWFDRQLASLRIAMNEPWSTVQPRQLFASMEQDVSWGGNNLNILGGWGVALPGYYDWKSMMEVVKASYKNEPTASDYQRNFARTIPGQPENTEARSFLPPEFQNGLREKAIKYQDEAAYWRMGVAAVDQMQINPDGSRTTFMRNGQRETLPEKEVRFIQQVFGTEDRSKWVTYNGRKVPSEILNWFTMDPTNKNKRKYVALMSTILEENIKDKLSKLSADDIDGVTSLARDVISKATEKKAESMSVDQSLARVVVKSGIVMEWGHFSSGKLGWGWRYETKGNQTVRTRTSGSTHVATDIFNGINWRESERGAQSRGFTSSGMLPAMSEEYMDMLSKEAPDFKPGSFNEIFEKDNGFRNSWRALWGGVIAQDARTKELSFYPHLQVSKDGKRYEQRPDWTAGKQQLYDQMKEHLWLWETPYTDQSGQKVQLPFFFPPSSESMNFFNAISLNKDDSSTQADLTVWEQLCAGQKLSELDWENMNDLAYNRWATTMQQKIRYLTTLVTPPSDRGYFVELFGSPASLPELNKRVALGERDEPQDAAFLAATLIPQMLIMRLADQHGIIGDIGSNMNDQGDWAASIAPWLVVLNSLPENGPFYTRMAQFYHKLFARYAYAVGETKRQWEADMNELLREGAKQDVGLNINFESVGSMKDRQR